MAIAQNHVINIQPGVSAPLVIHCSQGDTGTRINLTVVNGDEEFDCSSYACSVHGVRSDGANWGPYGVTVSGSTVSFSLRQEMTAIAGPCLAEITIGTVGTANFAILVENATFSLGVTYTEDVSLYQSILSYNMGAVQDIKTEATASVNKAIDQMNTNTSALNAKYDAAIANFNQGIATTQNQYAVTNARLDTAISAVTQDSEVQDIRVKADGTSASTAGNAVREQITELKNELNGLSNNMEAYEEETDAIIKYAVDYTETGNNSVLVNVQHPVTALKMTAISGRVGLYDGMIVLDGSEDENWSLHSSGRFYASGLGIHLTTGSEHVSSYMFCANSTSNEQKYFGVGGDGIYISKNEDYQTVGELKEYLSVHPLTVWYKTANYTNATLFYPCVTLFSGDSQAGVDFICSFGTDEAYSAIGTTDFVDFIHGTITRNGTVTDRFTPIVFTPMNAITITGGGKITITQQNVVATVKEVLDNLKSEVEDPTSEYNMPVLDLTARNQVPFVRLANILRGGLMCDDITNNEIIRLNRSGYKSHDGTIVKSGNMLYCIYCSYADGSTGGDAASNETAVVRLDGVSVATGERTIELVVAKKNGTYGNIKQTGGAGSPNAYLVGNTIHILYTAKMGTTYVEMHCKYNIATNTLGNYSPISANGSDLNVAWINAKYGYNFSADAYLNAQSNSTIATDGDGTYYIGWVWSYSTTSSYSHAIIFSTQDFVNWEIFKELEYQTIPVYELALAYSSGYLLFYFRPSAAGRDKTNNFGDDSMYGILGKIDIVDKTIVQAIKIQNCGSRPAFFWYDGSLYLFTNTFNRDNFEIIAIDTERIYESSVFSEGYGGYNYPSFTVDGLTIYFLHSGQNMQVSKYTPRSIGNADIRNKLLEIFET